MVKEIQNKHMFMIQRQFSIVIFTDDNASISLLEGDDKFLYHTPFFSFQVLCN